MVIGCLPTIRPPKRTHVGMAQRTTLPQAIRRLKKKARSQAMHRAMMGSTTLAKADMMKEGAELAQTLETRQVREDNTSQRANYAAKWGN